MPPLKEQTAGFGRVPLRAHAAPTHSVGTTHGIHPDDTPYLTDERPMHGDEDDTLYTTRLPTSTRRYTAPAAQTQPRTMIRVTRHQAPPPPLQRASRTQAPVHQHRAQPFALSQPTPPRLPLLWSIGLGMLLALLVFLAFSGLVHWWQAVQETWQYGYPRTYQCDANVGHGGVSHFTVENLSGHIIITQVLPGDLSHSKVYTGPVFSGPDVDQELATISFRDVNGDHSPDMIIAVGTGRYLLINTHTGFRPSTSADKITMRNFVRCWLLRNKKSYCIVCSLLCSWTGLSGSVIS